MSFTHSKDSANADEAALAITLRSAVASFDVAVTLGSGWAKATDLIGETVAEIPAAEVPGFSASGIPDHTGTIRSILSPSGKHAPVPGPDHTPMKIRVVGPRHRVRVAAACGTKLWFSGTGQGVSKNHGHREHR